MQGPANLVYWCVYLSESGVRLLLDSCFVSWQRDWSGTSSCNNNIKPVIIREYYLLMSGWGGPASGYTSQYANQGGGGQSAQEVCGTSDATSPVCPKLSLDAWTLLRRSRCDIKYELLILQSLLKGRGAQQGYSGYGNDANLGGHSSQGQAPPGMQPYHYQVWSMATVTCQLLLPAC